MKLSKMQYLKEELRKKIGDSISFVDVMERVYNKTRGQKNTLALITAAKQHKALIISHTKKWADELKELHPGIDATVYTDPTIHTFNGPVIMDLPVMWEFTKAFARLEKMATELLDFMDLKKVD